VALVAVGAAYVYATRSRGFGVDMDELRNRACDAAGNASRHAEQRLAETEARLLEITGKHLVAIDDLKKRVSALEMGKAFGRGG
jgi:hypothetical protein